MTRMAQGRGGGDGDLLFVTQRSVHKPGMLSYQYISICKMTLPTHAESSCQELIHMYTLLQAVAFYNPA